MYGSGPGANPHLYDQTDPDKLLTGTPENPNDLPRNRQGTALIGDPRNDENLIVSQLQLAFLKLHNAVVDHLRAQGVKPHKVFQEAQRLVRWHYQWIIVHEFLPLLIGPHLVDEILRGGLRYYQPGTNPFIPVEFSVAAYRFGHSQVRAVYQINGRTTKALFELPFFAPIQPDQVIDWSNLFHVSSKKPQFSRRIDARLARTLLELRPPIVPPGTPAAQRSLAVRNLKRGASFSLPAGQTVAKAMGVRPLSDEELGLAGLDLPGGGFDGAAPLWYYILKEAEVQAGGETLGQVGGRIVGEVLLGLLMADPVSYFHLEPHWQPDPAVAPEGQLVDLLKFAGVIPTAGPAEDSAPTPTFIDNKFVDLETFASAEPVLSPAGSSEPTTASAALKRQAGQPRLSELKIRPAETGHVPSFVRQGQPFDIRLILDLSKSAIPDNVLVRYTATAYAKRLDNGGSRQVIGDAGDTITAVNNFVVSVAGEGLPAGLYRLETTVTLAVLPNGPELTTLVEGSLLHVY